MKSKDKKQQQWFMTDNLAIRLYSSYFKTHTHTHPHSSAIHQAGQVFQYIKSLWGFFYFLIKSAFILPGPTSFLLSFHSDRDPPSPSRGERTHTHTHTHSQPIQLPWRALGGAAPRVFSSLIVAAVSLLLVSSVCVSLSRAGAPSYLTPDHTLNLTIQFMYW